MHVFYKRNIMGVPKAGKPGHGPYPTCHDEIIARRALYDFASRHNLSIRAEYGFGNLPAMQRLFTRFVNALSLGKLAHEHTNLMFIFERIDDAVSADVTSDNARVA